MWGAIKNDLFEFVNTVQTDTASSIAKVIKDDDDENSEEEEPPSAVEKAIQELNQSFTTFSEGVAAAHEKDFKKFMKEFSLSSNGSDIARILEWEDDVSKYYADLVPNVISADLFWGRYFFKRHIIEIRGPDHGLDDDDEEELAWDEGGDRDGGDEGEGEEGEISSADDLAGVIEESTPSKQSTNRVDCVEGLDQVALKGQTSALSGSPSHAPSTEIMEENMQLKQRVVELEQEVQQLRRALTEAQSMTSIPAVPVASSSEVSFVDIATDTDKEDDKQYIQCSNSPQETSSGSDRPVLIDEDSDFPNNSQSNVVARKKHTSSESTAESTSADLEVSADVIPSCKGTKETTKESTSPSSLPSSSHAVPPTSEGQGVSASAAGALPDLDEDEEGGWDSTW